MGEPTIQELIRRYGLEPHPEGGYFKETYRAAGNVPKAALPGGFAGERSYCTAIYFLLPQGARSKLHRIKSDEMWHFYLGDPLVVVQISPRGRVERITLGRDAGAGQKLQHVVPAGWWFGSHPGPGSAYSLVGCTVAPGFDFADFELGRRMDLLKLFPGARETIKQLTDE